MGWAGIGVENRAREDLCFAVDFNYHYNIPR